MVKSKRTLVPRDDRVTINHELASVEELFSEYVENISRSGIFIRVKRPLPVGAKINLKCTIVMEDIETIEGVGEVVRVSDQPRGMGVVFVTLTPRSQGLIDRLLAARREAKKPPPIPADATMKKKPGKS